MTNRQLTLFPLVENMTRPPKGQADRLRLANKLAPVVMQGDGTGCDVEWKGPCQARRPRRLTAGATGAVDHACALLYDHRYHRCRCGQRMPEPKETT